MNYTITIPCVKENLQEIRKFVKSSLQDHGLSEVEINALVLAIDEISANLIIHAHKNNPHDHIDLKIEVHEGEGVVKVSGGFLGEGLTHEVELEMRALERGHGGPDKAHPEEQEEAV